MFERFAHWLLSHRPVTGVVLGIVFCVLAGGTSLLYADMNVEGFFLDDDEAKAHFKDYSDFWGGEDNVVIVTVKANSGTILTSSRLHLLLDVIAEFQAKPTIIKSASGLPDYTQILSQDQDMVLKSVLETLPPKDHPDPGAHQAWADRLLQDPLLVPSLLSADGTTSVLFIELNDDTHDMRKLAPRIAWIRGVLSEYEGKEGLRFMDAGIISVRSDFLDAIITDQTTLVPIALCLMFFGLVLGFRSVHGVIMPLVAAFVPVGMILGVLGYTNEPVDTINNTLITLLPAIALADAIHLLNRYHDELRLLTPAGSPVSPELRRKAVIQTLSELGKACFLTSLTTAIGFASLYLAEMRVLKNFGLYAALGIVFSFCTVVLIVPLFLSIPLGNPLPKKPKASRLIHTFLTWASNVSIQHPRKVILVSLSLMALFSWFGTKVVVKNSLSAALSESHPTTQANALVDKQLGGVLSYEIDLRGDGPVFKDPGLLKALHKTEEWALGHPAIRAVISPTRFLSRSAEVLTGEKGIPSDPNLIAQLYLLLEGQEDLEGILTPDYDRARVIFRTQDNSSLNFIAFEEALKDQFKQNLSPYPVGVHFTGAATLGYRGIDHITHDMRSGLLAAFFIIALIIALEFKSLLIALLAILVNGFPLIVGYGILGAFGWFLEPTGALIFTVGLGIAVDDTIHLLARYFEEIRKGLNAEDAIRKSVYHCGKAVMLTSLILVMGIGANIFSSFTTVRGVGTSGVAIIIAALLCDLFFLPALLALTHRYLPHPKPAH